MVDIRLTPNCGSCIINHFGSVSTRVIYSCNKDTIPEACRDQTQGLHPRRYSDEVLLQRRGRLCCGFKVPLARTFCGLGSASPVLARPPSPALDGLREGERQSGTTLQGREAVPPRPMAAVVVCSNGGDGGSIRKSELHAGEGAPTNGVEDHCLGAECPVLLLLWIGNFHKKN